MRTKVIVSLVALGLALGAAGIILRQAAGQDLEREQRQGLNVLRLVFAGEGKVSLSGTRALSAPQRGLRIIQRVMRGPGHRYRIEAAAPDPIAGRLLVSDGSTRWLYDPKRGWAMVTQAADAQVIARRRAEWLSRVPKVFVVRYFGTRSLLGRQAHVVQLVRRHAPRAYRKYWVDAEHWVPLLRQQFAPDDTVVAEERYLQADFPSQPLPAQAFAFQPPRGTRVVRDPAPLLRFADVAALGERLDFRPALPQWIPDDFFLEDALLLRFRRRSVAWLRYTDIFNSISIFERQRPRGARGGPAPGGPMVVVRERGPLWIVVVGSLPRPVLERVADSIRP